MFRLSKQTQEGFRRSSNNSYFVVSVAGVSNKKSLGTWKKAIWLSPFRSDDVYIFIPFNECPEFPGLY